MHYVAATYDEDRYRDFDRRASHLRALRESPPVSRRVGPSLLARARVALASALRRDRHSLTSYPCRLPDGKVGRTTIVLIEGEWTAVCVAA